MKIETFILCVWMWGEKEKGIGQTHIESLIPFPDKSLVECNIAKSIQNSCI